MLAKKDKVTFTNLEGLRKDVKDWIDQQHIHTIKKVHVLNGEILFVELEEIDDEYPLLDDIPYVFLSDRLSVVNE